MNFGENHKKNVVCHIHCKILHKNKTGRKTKGVCSANTLLKLQKLRLSGFLSKTAVNELGKCCYSFLLVSAVSNNSDLCTADNTK